MSKRPSNRGRSYSGYLKFRLAKAIRTGSGIPARKRRPLLHLCWAPDLCLECILVADLWHNSLSNRRRLWWLVRHTPHLRKYLSAQLRRQRTKGLQMARLRHSPRLAKRRSFGSRREQNKDSLLANFSSCLFLANFDWPTLISTAVYLAH